MRWLLIFLMAATAGAQSNPRLTDLLTDSTDYTCVGTVPCATWPMPALPSPGASYTDPNWKTTTWRLATTPANTLGSVMPAYTRVQAWNEDGTLMFMTDLTQAGLDLYDATTTPPTPINLITTDGGSTTYPDSSDNDALWAFTDPKRIYFVTGTSSGNGLKLAYVDVSTCTAINCQLHYNVVHTFSCVTDAISNPELGAGVAGNKIETGSGGQGGLFDNTDTYFTFTCDKVDGTGRHEIDFIRYNRLTDTVIHQQKWYTLCPGGIPDGCAAYWGLAKQGRNLIRLNQHPDHKYIAVIWQAGGTNGSSGTSSAPTHINITGNVLTVTAINTLQVNTEAKFHNLSAATYLNNQFVLITSATGSQFTAAFTHADDDQAISSGTITGLSCQLEVNWVRGCGVEVFDDDFNLLGPAASYPGHQDTGYDINGLPVMVTVGSQRNDLVDTYALAVTDFTHLSPTAITSRRFLWPCSYSRVPTCVGTYLGAKAGASHISMTGTWGSFPGWGLFSTMMMAGPAVGSAPDYPAGTTLGTAVSPGTVTVTPASMSQIAVGVSSTVDTAANMETVKWTAATGTTATAVFTKSHAGSAAVKCLSCGDAGFAAMENLAVKIDSQAVDGTNLQYYRLGRTMAIRDNMYNAEPHTSVNRDFTQYIWGSTWNVDPGSSGTVNGFWSKLSSPFVAPANTVFSISRTASSQTPTPFPIADRICCGNSDWEKIETSRGTYVWTAFDAAIASLSGHAGSFPIYSDRYVPTWASGGTHANPPSDLAASAACQGVLTGSTTTNCRYKEFVTSLMQHVCGVGSAPVDPLIGVCTVKVFEAWNEMNVGNYWTGNAAQMAQMAEDKAAIIRLYCGDCTILGGSVSAGGDGTGGSWINGSVGLEPFLAAWGALSSPHLPDAVSWHAYPARTTIKPVPMPETLAANGGGTCSGSSNSSCRTAIKDQVAELYSADILLNGAISSWAANLPVWQTEGGYGINSAMTDGVSDTSVNTWFLRGAYMARWMAVQAATPSSGYRPVHSLVYSWQDQCWGTQNGTNALDGNCQPPDSVIPSGVTATNSALVRMQAWLNSSSAIGTLNSAAVSGGNVWTMDLTVAGNTQRLAWFDGWLATSAYATSFNRQTTLPGVTSAVSGTVTLDNQPRLLFNISAGASTAGAFWFFQ